MAEVGVGVMALPLAVFEDRDVLAAQTGSAIAALPIFSPSTEQNKAAGNSQKAISETGARQRRKQAEVSSAPHSLAQSVMLLRSQHPSSSQLPPSHPASTSKTATGHSEVLPLPDDVLSPPSPRSMQILGKSRGLKRDRLESSQPTPPAKRPAMTPKSASKPRPHKVKAAVPSIALSPPPQTAQPVGSNWWAQGSSAQPVQAPDHLAPAAHANLVQDHSRGGQASLSGAVQHMQPSGQQGPESWQPAHPSSPSVPHQAHTRGSRHIPSVPPAWASPHEQTRAEAWHSSPSVSRHGTVPGDQSQQQPSRRPAPDHHSSAAHQQPQAARYNGRSQNLQMQDLVNEVLAHDTPACWGNGSTQKQQRRAGAASTPGIRSPMHRAGGHSPGQRGQAPLQPEQSWPAPEGGQYILAPPPVSRKQQSKPRSAQAEWSGQRPGQQDDASGSLYNGHAGPAGYAPALQGGLQQLHQEVERFAAMAAPTVAEIRAVQQAQATITETALGIWPGCTVGSFGSQANATALPGSDIDVTILGVMDVDGATGIKRHQRDAVKAELQKLLKALRKRGVVVGKPLLITARVPIIKCTLAVPGGRIPADISLGVANGLSAVALVEQQALAIGPSMKALAVVLKALLQQAGLNERVAGGLGSYCLLNLVMAHLLSQGIDVESQYSLGHLLLSFLDCFGNTFDYKAKAVSVRAGGIVKKERQFKQKGKPMLLTIEDPQQPGTDIGSGAFNIAQAVKRMSKAHSKLRHEAERWGAGAGRAGQAPGWAAVQAEGQDASVAPGTNASFPLLSSIMDPGLSLERTAQAAQARAQAAKQSVDKVIKRTPKAPKKRKLRDEPTHLRFESEWSDTEPSESGSKKQKKQGKYKASKGQAAPKTPKKLALKKQSPKQSTKKQAKRKSFFMKALAKRRSGSGHKAQHRE